MPTINVNLSDGTELTFENLTDTAYMPLASVLMGDSGTMPNLDDPKLGAQILKNIADPGTIKRLAYGLTVLCPSIPDHLVWYDHPTKTPSFGIAGLSIADLTQIIFTLGNALHPQASQKQKTGFTAQPKKRRK